MNSKDYTARAVEYLSERPDWDGRTIVVTGGSQGGLQALVAAGLDGHPYFGRDHDWQVALLYGKSVLPPPE